VSVYVEVGASGAEVFVRDHGDGFDLRDIAEDRLGVRESILGRMARAGGKAKIRRLEQGTEIALSRPPLPHEERQHPEQSPALKPAEVAEEAGQPDAPPAGRHTSSVASPGKGANRE
jgi:hypothetical protein